MSRTAGALDALLSRVSTGALADPGPDDAQLRLMLEAAVRAPDHGKLRPWRFFVIRGEARTRLSELFASSIRRREPAAGIRALDRTLGRDVKRVHADVVALEELGLIRRDPETGALSTDIDEVASVIKFAA